MRVFSVRHYSSALKLQRRVPVPELAFEGIEWQHEPTGARVIHLTHDSPRTFSIAFRTLPSDSTGLPHILEHTALCGSAAFPVRDPFFKMLNRSLAVYMNAWTGSDFTQYPFSTENGTDWLNLRAVYMDAVLRPLLEESDFRQEGWRWIAKDRPEKGKEFALGGVVFNEMKGALSDPDSLFLTRHQQARFGPDSVYSVVSGGDPMDIPRLTHSQLVAFHKHFYHPSNAVLVSSGADIDLKEHLAYLEERLAGFADRRSEFGDRERLLWSLPSLEKTARRVEIEGPVDPLGDPKKQNRLLISFLANRATDLQTTFNMKILAHLLFEGPASPFYQALLLDGSLGTDYAAGTGYDTSTAHTQLAVGLQGLDASALKAAESRIDDTFAAVRAEPSKFFTPERVETALHQIQLGLRYSSANYGLSLVSSVTQAWVHEADPLEALLVDSKVQRFKEAWKAGGLFEGLLDRFVLGREARRLVFVMKPDTDYSQRLQSQEAALIDELKTKAAATLDLQDVEAAEAILKTKQDSEPDLSCLPCLRLDQVAPGIRDASLKEIRSGRWERVTPEANGLVYLRALVPLPSELLTSRQIALLPLLASSLTELGLTDMSAAAFDAETKRLTGGLSFSPFLGKVNDSSMDAQLGFQMASFALLANGSAMQSLLVSALSRANFTDLERLRSVLCAAASNASNSIASSGNQLAGTKAAALLQLPRAIKAELLSGLEQARFLDSLSNGKKNGNDKGLDSLKALAGELCELRDLVLDSASRELKVAVIAAESGIDTSLIEALGKHSRPRSQTSAQKTASLDNNQSESSSRRLFLSTPFGSNFAAMALNPHSAGGKTTPQERASLVLLARLLRTKLLHREIREKGGAYGASASYNSLSGLFVMSSYRDPEPRRSLDLFQDSCNRLFLSQQPQQPALTEQDLLEAKLATLSALDAPVDLAARGLAAFQLGINDAERQAYRDALLQTGLKEIRERGVIVSELLKKDHVSACVIGSEQQALNFSDYSQASLGE